VIHYTEEEINDCILSLIPGTVKGLVDLIKQDNPGVEEDYGEIILYIICPKASEGYLICTVSSFREYVRENTWEVLQAPIEDVPLYINSWPQIAQWRLKIAK
jgi:hypothetical protein